MGSQAKTINNVCRIIYHIAVTTKYDAVTFTSIDASQTAVGNRDYGAGPNTGGLK